MNLRTLVGVHRSMPARDYHALPGASASRLRKLWQSTPAHLFAEMKEPKEPTPAMILGTLAHQLVLEPGTPLPKLVIPPAEYPAPPESSLVKSKKVAAGDMVKWSWSAGYCQVWKRNHEQRGFIVVSQDIYDNTNAAARSIAEHPEARELVADGDSEVTLITWDRETDCGLRCRLDHVPKGPLIVDCKFTHDASERGFERNAYDNGYHIQAALYLDVWNALCGSEERKTGFAFIACEPKPPYAVNVFRCTDEFIERGRHDYITALASYAECERTGKWPAYPTTVKELGIPRYAKANL